MTNIDEPLFLTKAEELVGLSSNLLALCINKGQLRFSQERPRAKKFVTLRDVLTAIIEKRVATSLQAKSKPLAVSKLTALVEKAVADNDFELYKLSQLALARLADDYPQRTATVVTLTTLAQQAIDRNDMCLFELCFVSLLHLTNDYSALLSLSPVENDSGELMVFSLENI